MELIKYCKEEHNPLLLGTTLQLGTGKYYRNMDPSFGIADPEEGFVNYRNDELGIDAFGNVGQNCYMFCVSTTNMTQEEARERLNSEYNSRYYIQDSFHLAVVLSYAIKDQLTLDDIDPESMRGLTADDLKDVMVACFRDKVSYRDDPYELETAKVQAPEFTLGDTMFSFWSYLRANFTKRKKYAHDTEYRFYFVIVHRSNMILSVKEDSKRVTFSKREIEKALSKNRRDTAGIENKWGYTRRT
ncbi:hypothetical protein [Hymenobacter sp. GOD-10R]|uniref:hypothetical protein n=1 Tax=Hymenobacter sp. GOD-10R TaxID=3093922 RepID=UPI002D79A7BD|nr:hypothetical protein [Hymenobacter sp. GOD-10R]WRQ31950.1 hypothetical protein SD425_29495 [Hymenobacter sp. GOD-10R]